MRDAPFIVGLADRTHVAVLPVTILVFSLVVFTLAVNFTQGASFAWDTPEQVWGSALMFSILPAYLLFSGVFSWRYTDRALDEMADLFADPALVRTRVLAPPAHAVIPAVLVGIAFSISQNPVYFLSFGSLENPVLDTALVGGNTAVWVSVGLILSWRIYAAWGLRVTGKAVAVDLYNLHRLRPFARVALVDLLMIMGAMALMPLQALDLEFRWFNYEAGLLVGVVAVVLLAGLPLHGVHQAIVAAREKRLDELQQAVNRCPREDIERLERLVAHRDRIEDLHTWPFDLRLLMRAIFYLVLPPLAWVGAALVENVVDRFL